MDHLDTKLRAAVARISHLVVRKDFGALSELTKDGPDKLNREDFARTIEAYPATFRLPAEEELLFEVIELDGSMPRRFSIDAPLFTIEEGRSDLNFRMTVIDGEGDSFEIVLYDIWAM